MPDLSDTVAKCRMGTAKKFYTSIASLYYTTKRKRFVVPAKTGIGSVLCDSELDVQRMFLRYVFDDIVDGKN